MAVISRSKLLKELLPSLNDLFDMEYNPVDIPNANEIKLLMKYWRTNRDHWSKFNPGHRGAYESWWEDTLRRLRDEDLYPVVWAIKTATDDQNVTAAVAALIAHPECHTMLEMTPDALRLMRESGNHEAKLLYPAVCLINGVEP